MCGHEGVLTPELEDDPDPRDECGEMAPDTSPKEGLPCSESRQLISPGLHSIKTPLASQIRFCRRRYFASVTGMSSGLPSTYILAESKKPATVRWNWTSLSPLFCQNQP